VARLVLARELADMQVMRSRPLRRLGKQMEICGVWIGDEQVAELLEALD